MPEPMLVPGASAMSDTGRFGFLMEALALEYGALQLAHAALERQLKTVMASKAATCSNSAVTPCCVVAVAEEADGASWPVAAPTPMPKHMCAVEEAAPLSPHVPAGWSPCTTPPSFATATTDFFLSTEMQQADVEDEAAAQPHQVPGRSLPDRLSQTEEEEAVTASPPVLDDLSTVLSSRTEDVDSAQENLLAVDTTRGGNTSSDAGNIDTMEMGLSDVLNLPHDFRPAENDNVHRTHSLRRSHSVRRMAAMDECTVGHTRLLQPTFSRSPSRTNNPTGRISRARRVYSLGRSFVTHAYFDMAFASLIICNVVIMALEVQLSSVDLSNHISSTDSARSSVDTWPNASKSFDTLNMILGILFACELALLLVFLQLDFFKSALRWLDTCIVLCWILNSAQYLVAVNPVFLRLLRLLKMVRLARMVKTIQSLDSLQVIMGSISACVSVLVWSGIILGLTMTVMSMLLNAMLVPHIEDNTAEGMSLETRKQLFVYFGSFTRAMYTMYELTMGNFVPVTRLLVEHVSEGYGAFLVIYRFIVGFAIVKVITGVFMHETFRVAASDDDLMIVQKNRTSSRHAVKMAKMMGLADSSLDGRISKPEFLVLMQDPTFTTWLSSMDVEVNHPELLFEFLDDGDGEITLAELTTGIGRLKGQARSMDVISVITRCQDLRESVGQLDRKLNKLLYVNSMLYRRAAAAAVPFPPVVT
eukprot:NODE_1824_length_2365_cov_11.065684.p1 GENE.NODE_1824_length_2365_cov_11.065684~~NODE_1824_length_2365_cov_11.065684.p1  ORF type:complete len:703 (+),score=117.11 NODE_1824_length_2365_cov_11.065684:64-2172(+)